MTPKEKVSGAVGVIICAALNYATQRNNKAKSRAVRQIIQYARVLTESIDLEVSENKPHHGLLRLRSTPLPLRSISRRRQGCRVVRILKSFGIETVGQLVDFDEVQFWGARGCGSVTFYTLRDLQDHYRKQIERYGKE